MSASDSISPTAHYTSYVWARNGRSDPSLATAEGRLLFESVHPIMRLSDARGGGRALAPWLGEHHQVQDLDALRSSGRVQTAPVRPAGQVTQGAGDRGAQLAHILEAST